MFLGGGNTFASPPEVPFFGSADFLLPVESPEIKAFSSYSEKASALKSFHRTNENNHSYMEAHRHH